MSGVSQPVWAGEADALQYRMSRRPPDLRLHFINTTGTAAPSDRVLGAIRGAANNAVVTVAGLASAGAAEEQPKMVAREEWGAEDCQPRQAPAYGAVKLAFVHHTATATGYTPAEARAMVLGICRYHRNSNGWDDIGYNFLVDKYGTIYEGRAGGVDRAVMGAHVQGFNSQSTGIGNLGDYSATRESDAGMKAMARLIRWKLPLHGQRTDGRTTVVSGGGEQNPYPEGDEVRLNRISGHRDGGLTECPGDALYGQLPRLRRLSDVTPPDPPRDLAAESGRRQVSLDWRRNGEGDLDGYRVYRQKHDGSWRRIASVGRSRFTDEDRRAGRTYTYRVRAYDRAGNRSGPSNVVAALVERR